MKNKFLLGALVLLLSITQASAEWVVPAKVRFNEGVQYTPWSEAQVRFVTGAELNRAMNAFTYNALGGRYAIVPLGNGQSSIVQLTSLAFCTGNFNPACLPGGRSDGIDRQGRHWQICTTQSCL